MELFNYVTFGILILLIVIVIILLFVLMNNNKKTEQLKDYIDKEMDERQDQLHQLSMTTANSLNDMKLLFKDELQDFSDSLQNRFNDMNDRTSNKLMQMESHISGSLSFNTKTSNEVLAQLHERIVRIDEAQKNLNDLSQDIVSLQDILQDKKTRGTFGEVELYSLLEASFGIDPSRYQKQYHLPNGSIADAVLFSNTSLGNICIDSKFPLENYRKIYGNEEGVSREDARKLFKKDVLKHLNDIHDKYIIPSVTAEMAYMFIPAEAVFAEIYGYFPDIIERSYQLKVYLVSPTTLMAYLTALRNIYLGQKKDEKAKEMQDLLLELSDEFRRFYERMNTLNRDYQKITKDFELLSISSEKIIKRFDRINKVEIEEKDSL